MADSGTGKPAIAPATRRNERRAFILTAGIGAMLIPAAAAIAAALSIDLAPQFGLGVVSIVCGLLATAPLVALLAWFMKTGWRPLADFRASQLQFFSEIGFELTPRRGAVLALIAGVSEELMFRGVLQTAADRQWPLAAAIFFPSILFGILHARTVLYAIVAGFVSAYLGILFWMTQSLLAPMITHALYDFIALCWTWRAIGKAGLAAQSGRAKSSASSVIG